MKTSERPFEAADRREKMPFGSSPASSANRQNRIRSRKWATRCGSWPRERRLWAISAKCCAACSVIWAGCDSRAELLGRREDVAEHLEGVGGVVGRQVVEGDELHDRAEAR